jgi:hypothetical protein
MTDYKKLLVIAVQVGGMLGLGMVACLGVLMGGVKLLQFMFGG